MIGLNYYLSLSSIRFWPINMVHCMNKNHLTMLILPQIFTFMPNFIFDIKENINNCNQNYILFDTYNS